MSLGLNAEERERFSYIKNNSDHIDFHYICIWLECDTDKPLVQLINTILIVLRLDMLCLLKKQRDDYIIDAVFSRGAYCNDYNECGNEHGFKFLRFKWSIESMIRDSIIITNALSDVYEGLGEQWLSAYDAKTDGVKADKSKQNYMNNIAALRHRKCSLGTCDKNRIYLPYHMFHSLHGCQHTENESCFDSYSDNEYQSCKSSKPDFIVISRLFFEYNFKFEKLIQ